MDDYAVYVKNAEKSYGEKQILKKLTMKVPRGCIYGLLGASGCGKTTLLSCIVGRKKLDAGEVTVMGKRPGTEGSGVPGTLVGYMPQDIALVGEFTVKDAIYYFGRILNLPDNLIAERFKRLKDLLELPPDDRFLKNCSGGQQRRVSFATALLHKPQILILDEPTVGLDPVLRDRIWKYLVAIAEKENTAVIITTHYIEEARQANRIGLMREGRLLAEHSPDGLLQLFNTDTLEEVFLILSRRQEEGRLSDVSDNVIDEQNNSMLVSPASSNASIMDIGHASTEVLHKKEPVIYETTTGAFNLNRRRLKSLLSKNTKQFLRNSGGMAFTFIFPIIEMLAFLLAVGGDIKAIKIGVINDESLSTHCANYTKVGTAMHYDFTSCHFFDLGCRFINEIQDPMFNLINYDEYDKAIDDIKHGKIVGVMYIASNFSESFEARLNQGRRISDATLENSQVNVWLDMSNRQIGQTIKYKLLKRYIDFSKSLFKDCELIPKLGEIPLRFSFEYGEEDESYTNFMVPGVLLTVMFFLGTTLTSTIIVTDRLEGVWDRSIVAGVSSLEIVITHFITQFMLVVIQSMEVVVLTFFLYGIEYIGKISLIFLFVVLQGLTGMVFGFWVSIVADNHTAANTIGTGLFYPMILLCGMVWPLEAQPAVLKFISQCLPFTIPIISLRQVIKKGYPLSDGTVMNGIFITLIWIVALSIISVFAIKAKR